MQKLQMQNLRTAKATRAKTNKCKRPEMQKLIEHGILLVDKIDMVKMKEMSKKDHSLSHSHSNSIMVEPKKTGEIIWKFSKDIVLEMACNIPGHYESGMVGKIVLK